MQSNDNETQKDDLSSKIQLAEVPKVAAVETKKGAKESRKNLTKDESKNESGTKLLKKQISTALKQQQPTREGKLIPAVDFMDMNKTMINFRKERKSSIDGQKFDSSVMEESKDTSTLLGPS